MKLTKEEIENVVSENYFEDVVSMTLFNTIIDSMLDKADKLDEEGKNGDEFLSNIANKILDAYDKGTKNNISNIKDIMKIIYNTLEEE